MRFCGLPLILLVACTVDHSGLIDDAARDSATPDVIRFDGGSDGGPFVIDAGPDAAITRDAGFDAGDDAGPVDPCTVGPDSDDDGIVDSCDDWPCGTRPMVSTNVAQEHIRIRNVDIEGMGNTAVLNPAEPFRITFDYAINDAGCPGCIDQIEWGFTRIGRLGCAYSGNPPDGGDSGSAEIPNIPIPRGAEGLYELRFNLGQDYVCGMRDWWDREPGPAHTVGVVCIPPARVAVTP